RSCDIVYCREPPSFDKYYGFTSWSRTSASPIGVPNLRSTSCGMTGARGHRAIVYCLNSESEVRQTGKRRSGTRKRESREKGQSPGERTDGRRRKDGKVGREKVSLKKRVGDRESDARLEWRKGLSSVKVEKKKDEMNAGGVEKRNMN
ncbi:hypothetical protein TNCV_4899081, partial [Trichonephila clavipes]